MPKKLYQDNAYLKTINATINDTQKDEKRVWHLLDQTIFYPGGGGQAEDQGTIDGLPLLGVKKEGEQIWYALEKQLSGSVQLALDWNYRFENMRQHSGQHVLSAVFYNLINAETVSVHLGREDTLIELQYTGLTDEQLDEVEREANAIIREHVDIDVALVQEDEIKNYPLRRSLKVGTFPARLVSIAGHDCTGCGGTHVRNTSEIGLIKIIGVEKIRGRFRVVSRIGQSAYIYFEETHQAAKRSAAMLSSKITDLPIKISSFEEDRRQLTSALKRVSISWLKLLIQSVEREANQGFRFYQNEDLNDNLARQFSAQWVRQNDQILFLLYGSALQKFSIRLPDNISANASDWIKYYGETVGLRGGGSVDYVQGIIIKNTFNSEKVQNHLADWIGGIV